MSKGKIIKTIGLIILIAILLLGLKYFYSFFFTGKQIINVRTTTSSYAGSNLDAIVSVQREKDNRRINSKISYELLNSDDKVVKETKGKTNVTEAEDANISIHLPEDLNKGRYTLKITSKKGLFRDKAEIDINVGASVNNEAIISLDKGIYKPGDEVNYRALIISKKDNKPLSTETTVYIYDGNDNKVYSEKANTSDFGIVSGTFKLANEVNSGTYKICVNVGNNEFNKSFNVNPYIAPKFEVSLNTDKEKYVVGDNAEITVACKYFFGEPVTNASVKGTINDEEITGLTDSEGNFKYTYKMDESEIVKLDVDVTDSSNYMIEQSKNISCGTDLFEIEILPEFGGLSNVVNNDIYVFTKTVTGEPVKTYSTVKLDTFTKQLISDENGIGKITFTKDELNKINTKAPVTIMVEAKDMEENIVKKDLSVNFLQNEYNLIKTDKVVYEKGDDISLELFSKISSNRNIIYVLKGKELLKTISFESSTTGFNLGDITGLVDIYVPNSGYYSKYGYNYYTYDYDYDYDYGTSGYSNYSKRTIFIKPNDNLNIGIELDKSDYKPGDSLKIGFTTTDQNSSPTDAALLVSILDEAILSLADNDLSIDNVKLALEDIELVDGVTAADLYASVMGNGSETLLMGTLLKQSKSAPNIVDRTYRDYSSEEDLAKAILCMFIIGLVLFIYFAYKSNKFRNIIKKAIIPIVDVLIIFILLFVLTIDTDIFYDLFDYNVVLMLVSILVISIVIYVLILYKFKDEIFRVFYELILPGIVVLIIESIVYGIFWDYTANYILILAALIIFTILTALNRKNKLKGFLKYIYIFFINLIKFAVFSFVLYLLAELTDNVQISLLICLIIYFIFNIFVFVKGDKKEKREDGKIVLNVTPMEIIGMVLGVGLILVVFLIVGLYIYNSAQTNISSSLSSMSVNDYNDDSEFQNMGIPSNGRRIYESSVDTATSGARDETGAASSVSKLPGILNFASNVKSADGNEEYIIEEETNQTEDPISNSNTQEETTKIRNIFLESLAFIPELVTENGKADTNIRLSDNITTWSIQTVGNTKDGKLGYTTKEFKVFQEYFIDFSLPANAIVGDKVSIPVTIYNYTEDSLDVELDVKTNNWCTIGEYQNNVSVPANGTQMIYVPIEITADGENSFRVESKAGEKTDVVERNLNVKVNGLEVESMVSSGIITENYSMDILFDEKYISGTEKLKLRIFPSAMVQTIDNIDAMLRLPTGCFEQTSSSLYPDILVLKYLQNSGLDNKEVKEMALDYISKGYQKLLTYEVKGTKGGYSLYGNSPAEPVITAFGLMEFNELKEVYDVDEDVIENMKEYLFKNQKINGSFNYSSTYIGGALNTDEVAMSAYIGWALSEVCPDDSRLEKTIDYLEGKVDSTTDNYTLALIANVFANTNKDTSRVIKLLMDKINVTESGAYIGSTIRDYYGTYGNHQNVQTTALTSIALSKTNKESKNNSELVNYIIANKYAGGTWGTTQATILALKAVNEFSTNSDISEQTLTINLNGKSNNIEIKDDILDVYELEFDNVSKENKLSIGMKKGKLIYEVIKDYYVDYSEIEASKNIDLAYTITENVGVNGEVTQSIKFINNTDSNIENGLLKINIPQGTSVIEDSLLELKYKGIIEKYEYNYNSINIYFRNVEKAKEYSIDVKYRALYPEEITGGSLRFYDYYNPETEAIVGPTKIIVK